MSSIKAGENNNLVPAQPKTTDEGTPENNKTLEVHDATEKTTDLSPKNVETEHKEEVLTGNLAQKAAQAMKLVQEKQAKGDDDEAAAGGRKQRARNRAEDLVPMEGFGRGYADYLLPSTFGGTRAGRAAMVAKALGQTPDFSVSHPNTDVALNSLVGGATFGLGGAGIGALLGALGGSPAAGALVGGGVGGLAGSLGGVLGSGMERREQMQKIQDSLAKELNQHGSSRLNLKTPQYGLGSAIFSPLGGAHRSGQADAYEALKNNTRYKKTPGRTAGYVASHIPYVGPLLNMGHGAAQTLSARKRMKQEKPEIADEYGLDEFGPAKAAASAKQAMDPRAPAPKPMVPGMKAAAGGFDMNALMASLKAVAKPAGYGAMGGAALGGLAGLLAPGRDENGNTRGRFGAAMRGALGGGALGGLGGAAMGHYAKPATEKIMSGISQAGNQIQQQGAKFYKNMQQAQLPSSVTAWGAG